jgi:hypothetical protein
MSRTRAYLMTAVLAGVALLAPSSAGAQWRAEAGIAAGRAVLPAHIAAPSPITGAVTVGLARELGRRGRWSIELLGDAGHEALAGGSGGDARSVARVAWSIDARAGLQLEGGGSVAWRSHTRGASLDVPSPMDTTLAQYGADRRPKVAPLVRGLTGGLGAWARARGVLLTASARTTTLGSITEPWQAMRTRLVDSADVLARFDSVNGIWHFDTVGMKQVEESYMVSGERIRRLLQTDLSVGASSGRGPLGLALAGGVRRATLGERGEGWATLRATWAVSGDLALSVQASRLAADAQRSLPSRRELQLGVLLRPWGHSAPPVALPAAAAPAVRSFAVRPAGEGRMTLVLHVPGARSVELMGDFTAWRIVALERGRGDTWQLTLDLARGVHQLNVRIDGGAWMPPPGLGVGDDGFGGTFGLLVL